MADVLSRRARFYLIAICAVVIGFQSVRWILLSSWEFGGDMEAYWQAAMRLRAGAPLYPALTDLDAHNVYRYAPWFAAAWIPLTFIPKAAIATAWVGLMFICALVALYPLAKHGTPGRIFLALIAPLMIQSAWFGQVQPLLVMSLILGIGRNSGPVWIGIAASLKASPILFVLVYVARREWKKVIASILVAAILGAPTFFFDLSDYPFNAGVSVSLWSVEPILGVAGAVLAIGLGIWIALSQPRWGHLAAGAATLFAAPRAYLDLISYLLPAVHDAIAAKRDDS